MIDENMIALAEIKNGYTLPKYGNLTLEQDSLIKYDNLCLKLIEENRELKKQLEENKHKGLYNTCLPYSTGYNKAIKEKENQQKEFIDYLENEININPYDISDYDYEYIINTILSKDKK